jgi:hypothetical protein
MVAILAAAVVAVTAEIVRNVIAGAAAISSSIIGILLLLGLLLVLAQLNAVRSSVDQLSRKAAFSIDYYKARNAREIRELHQAARRVIERAPPDAEIFAVNSYVEVFRESNDPAFADSQRDYLRSYEKRFDAFKRYHRLIQVNNGRTDDSKTSLGDRLAPAYLEHYRAMAGHAESNLEQKIKLWRAAALLPTSFVVVKNGNGGDIIWQMNHQDSRLGVPEAERMEGVFIVTDPDGLLVQNFIDWYIMLDASSTRTAIKTADLRTSDAAEQ